MDNTSTTLETACTHTEALLAAWDADDVLDPSTYYRALENMSSDGAVPCVLVWWSRWIACAYLPGTSPLQAMQDDECVTSRVVEYGERLVGAARNDFPEHMYEPLQQAISDLTDAEIHYLVLAMVQSVDPLMRRQGGMVTYRRILGWVEPWAQRCGSPRTADPITYLLAVISRGHREAADEAMEVLLRLSNLGEALTTLIMLAAETFTNPGRTFLSVDPRGVPDGFVSADDASVDAQRLSTLLEAIRAIRAHDLDRAHELIATIGRYSTEDKLVLTWQLAHSVGYQLIGSD